MKNLVWNVFYYDINGKQIKTFNVFSHSRFREEIRIHFEKHTEKEAFGKELQSSLFRYFGHKCEWEVVIAPWYGGREAESLKIDVYQQVMNNWEVFLDYVWNSKRSRNLGEIQE